MTARFVRTQKEMEGRYEDVWALVDEADDVRELDGGRRADARRQAGSAPRRDACGQPDARATRSTSQLAGMLHAAVLRSPVAHGRVRSLDLDAALAVAGCAGGDRARERAVADARGSAPRGRARLRRAADRSRRGRHARGGAGRASARWRSTSRCSPHIVDPQRGRQRAALHRRAERRLPGRRRGRARGRRGHGRGLDLDTSAQLQAPLEPHAAVASWDGDAAHRLGVDAGDVLRTRGARGGVRAAEGRRPGADGVRRRRLRRQAGRRLRGARRCRAGARSRAGPCGSSTTATARCSTAAAASRREQTYRLGANRDGTLTAIEAEAVVAMGQGGWAMPALIPARTLYRCADVRALLVSRQAPTYGR